MTLSANVINLDANGKNVKAYLANGGGAGILVLHAWWGLKPFFKQVCDRLSAQGFTVLAPICGMVRLQRALMKQKP